MYHTPRDRISEINTAYMPACKFYIWSEGFSREVYGFFHRFILFQPSSQLETQQFSVVFSYVHSEAYDNVSLVKKKQPS